MGGLVNGQTVKGDLWMIEAGGGALTCFPVKTEAEGPGPRVGHASLLVGNAFIVFGGDTKQDETDPLDDTLYLLNTCEIPFPALPLNEPDMYSYEAMVESSSTGCAPSWAIWPHLEHIRLKAVHIWRAG